MSWVGCSTAERRLVIADSSFRSILGPALGGALAQPCETLPAIFSRNSIFGYYPFLLPNLVCAMVLVIGVVVGTLFLKETHEVKRCRRDIGIEAGEWLLDQLRRSTKMGATQKAVKPHSGIAIDSPEDEAPPGYRTTEGSPRQSSSRSQSPHGPPTYMHSRLKERLEEHRGAQKAFTKQVILIIAGFGLLA